jgi:hypothetical protein
MSGRKIGVPIGNRTVGKIDGKTGRMTDGRIAVRTGRWTGNRIVGKTDRWTGALIGKKTDALTVVAADGKHTGLKTNRGAPDHGREPLIISRLTKT